MTRLEVALYLLTYAAALVIAYLLVTSAAPSRNYPAIPDSCDDRARGSTRQPFEPALEPDQRTRKDDGDQDQAILAEHGHQQPAAGRDAEGE
jgi:hypothetical protein